jgi:hypothetical protein
MRSTILIAAGKAAAGTLICGKVLTIVARYRENHVAKQTETYRCLADRGRRSR